MHTVELQNSLERVAESSAMPAGGGAQFHTRGDTRPATCTGLVTFRPQMNNNHSSITFAELLIVVASSIHQAVSDHGAAP